MNSFSKVKPEIPTESKHGLTHVVQSAKWDIWNTLAIQLYLSPSPLHISCRTFNTSLLDEANAFFRLWHFKVRDVEGVTVSNYVQLILARQIHKNACETASLDKTLFNIKRVPHILWAVGWWTAHHTKGHKHMNPLQQDFFIHKKDKNEMRHFWPLLI